MATHEFDINIGDWKSVAKAEKAFGALSLELEQAITLACLETAEEAENTAREALDTNGLGDSSLQQSIYIEQTIEGIKIGSNSDHADFVEFGTGIVGSESPHPNPSGWVYDTNGHGWDGWMYYDSAHKLHWTAGMPSRPFLYPAFRRAASIISPKVTKYINRAFKAVGAK